MQFSLAFLYKIWPCTWPCTSSYWAMLLGHKYYISLSLPISNYQIDLMSQIKIKSWSNTQNHVGETHPSYFRRLHLLYSTLACNSWSSYLFHVNIYLLTYIPNMKNSCHIFVFGHNFGQLADRLKHKMLLIILSQKWQDNVRGYKLSNNSVPFL